MFGLGKNKSKKENVDNGLYSPVKGDVISIDKVSDPVFAQKMMGEGYAVEPADNKICAPVSGTVTMMQGHAVGLVRADGLEVLLHIGLDTVSLNGAPFSFKVKTGDAVNGGEEIGTADFAAVEAAGLQKTVVVVFTNTGDKLEQFTVNETQAESGEKIGEAVTK
ncbi:PTS glucose transporter subunit IIA [Lactovum odontotermitis]